MSSRSNKKTKKSRQEGGFYEPPTASSQILSMSSDGRRLRVQSEVIRERVALADRTAQMEADLGASDGGSPFVQDPQPLLVAGAETVQGVQGMAVMAKTRAKRYPASVSRSVCFAWPLHELTSLHAQDEPLRTWIPYRDQYLDEVLRLEGRAWARTTAQCPRCTGAVPTFRCTDCTGGDLLCQGCLVEIHAHLPLHRVQVMCV